MSILQVPKQFFRGPVRRFNALPDMAKGSLLVISATILFSFMVLIIKLLGARIEVVQIIFIRQVLMGCIMLPVIAGHFSQTLRSKAPHLQLLRICFALVAISVGFTAVVELPLAESTTIGFARSFFVTLLAIYFLHEAVGPRRWVAIVVGFIGVLIVMRPGTDAFTIYSLFALVASAAVGAVTILNSKLSKIDGAQTTVTLLIIGVAIIFLPFAIHVWIWPTFQEWLLFGGLALVTWTAQMMNVAGFKYGDASFLAGLDYIRLTFAVAMGYLVFGDVPDLLFYVGSAVIVGAAIYTLWREAVRQQVIVATPKARSYTPE